ncbi:hypothetical protein FA95DRAFT_1606033 [Auriscalpium vulgare]|uniref:Uncharacterized protein n=1 Tax=Auriscalpium vulgare TaxID=40419 RepID=A0ACB8RU79_9AGAM|nr:hypothetical protein FA95DRAFT_1606033 [Auriscalpium vulgare]
MDEESPAANTSDALHPGLTGLGSSSGHSLLANSAEANTLHREECAITSASQDFQADFNDLLPFARFPPELVCLIFTHLSDIDPPTTQMA